MARAKLPALDFGGGARSAEPADELADPARYRGVLWRRAMAHAIDLVLIGALIVAVAAALIMANVLTFGILSAPVAVAGLLAPILYFVAYTGGERSATPGMRALDIELRTWTGARPDHVRAALRTILYYATMTLLTPLVIVVALFNPRRRALHDILSGTVVVARAPDGPR